MTGTFDPPTVERIVALLQSGEQVCVEGNGRWSKTLLYRSGHFFFDIFDEGSSSECGASDEEFARALVEAPDAFRELLARPAWKSFYVSFVDGDRTEARAALALTEGMPGPAERFRHVFEALLAWPEQAPSPELRAQLKELVRGGMALHPFRLVVSGREDEASTRKGIEYMTALGDITGWPRCAHEQRADFYEKLGDLQAALADCLEEKKIESGQFLAQRIQRLRQAIRR